MKPSFIIRRAVESDAESIIRFNTAMALETEHKVLPEDKIRPGVSALFRKPEYGFYLVAVSGERVVGCLMVTYEWSDWRNGLFWWIQSVYVIPEFRRSGVYRSMYNTLRELAAGTPDHCGFRLYVEKDNRTAQETYTALGMNETRYALFEEMTDRNENRDL
ncbi:MAG: GNAT family N-acetyltransferase [Rhodothermaceae bacterium]|nr:GNAT family N-acetyltransferase [Rhodothermaceae bacterium]